MNNLTIEQAIVLNQYNYNILDLAQAIIEADNMIKQLIEKLDKLEVKNEDISTIETIQSDQPVLGRKPRV